MCRQSKERDGGLALCDSSDACLGYCFQSPDEHPSSNVGCITKTALHLVPISPDGNCPSPGQKGMPKCEPLPGEMGLGGYYGHYQGHWLSATAFLYNNTRNATVKDAADQAIATLARVMDAWSAKYPDRDGYLFPYDPLVFDQLLRGEGGHVRSLAPPAAKIISGRAAHAWRAWRA